VSIIHIFGVVPEKTGVFAIKMQSLIRILNLNSRVSLINGASQISIGDLQEDLIRGFRGFSRKGNYR
jgi:hypothetical protein